MNQRTQYLIHILDKIGGPLMDAVVAAPHPEGETSVESDAQAIASLLGKVVEASISMNEVLDLKPEDAQNDSLRLALAGLVGPLIAGQYAQNYKIPEETDLKRMQSALQAVLTFGDNFTPSDEHIERLRKLESDGAPLDTHQVNIQYVHAFIPVVNAVGAFSFGQPEQKLIMDISDRIVKQSVEMREALLPELSGDDQKLAELGLLRALVQIYAACHSAETHRLTALKDQETPDASGMDVVWKGFDTRIAMLEALVRNILPGGGNVAPAAVAPAPEVQTAAPPAAPASEPPAAPASPIGAIVNKSKEGETAAEAPPPPVTPPATPATPPAAPPAAPADNAGDGSGSPMGFFKKPGSDSAAPPPTAPETPAPPAEPPPPATPPAQPETPPAAPPETPPASEESGNEDGNSDGDNGGSPMSFFKKSD